MIRESPAKASLGRTSVRTNTLSGGYMISSFFEVFTEVSLDGGDSWSPSVTAPDTLALATNNLVAISVSRLINPIMLGNDSFRFAFTNAPGATFTVLVSTKVALPLGNWTVLGTLTEVSPGQYQFTDAQSTNRPLQFYRVRFPWEGRVAWNIPVSSGFLRQSAGFPIESTLVIITRVRFPSPAPL